MHIGTLFAALKGFDLIDDTIVIVVADHGDEFFEHGDKGHLKTLYNEVIHVPLILTLPGLRCHHTIDSAVSIVDIMPTGLDILGISSPAAVDGTSLLPLIRGTRNTRGASVFSELRSHLTAIIQAPWKAVYNTESQRLELYNITEDPQEKDDLSSAAAARAVRYREEIRAWRARTATGTEPAPQAELDRKGYEQLKALGYIQ